MGLPTDTVSWLESLTVAKLKDELKQRGLAVSGLKAELLKRLTGALEEEEQAKADQGTKRSSPAPSPSPQEDKLDTGTPAKVEPVQEAAVSKPDAPPVSPKQKSPEPKDPSPPPPTASSPAPPSPAKPAAQPSPKPTEPEEDEVDYGVDEEPPTAQQESDAPAQKPDTATPEPAKATPGEDGSTKRRRAAIQFQPKAKATPVAAEPAPVDTAGAEPDADEAAPAATSSAPSSPEAPNVASPVASPGANKEAAEGEAVAAAVTSRAVRIDNLTRPFTEPALKALISNTGTIQDFWMPAIKTHALVILETVEQAAATLDALDKKKWPAENPKLLKVTYLSVEEASSGIEAGRNPVTGRPIVVKRVAASTQAPKTTLTATLDAVHDSPAQGSADAAPHVRRPIGVGLGAVAAAKAALQAAVADAGLKRGRSASQDGSDQVDVPAAKRVHADAQQQQGDADMEPGVLSLDTLFRKTVAKPNLYWLPLTDEQVQEKKQRLARLEAMRDAQPAQEGPPKREHAGPGPHRFNNHSGRGHFNGNRHPGFRER